MTRDQFWTEVFLRALTGTASDVRKFGNSAVSETMPRMTNGDVLTRRFVMQSVRDAALIADFSLNTADERKLFAEEDEHKRILSEYNDGAAHFAGAMQYSETLSALAQLDREIVAMIAASHPEAVSAVEQFARDHPEAFSAIKQFGREVVSTTISQIKKDEPQ